ncbi:MAG: 3-hydroxyacyl-ACP dehydratase FabZ [Defluviitaleaceae bacterium]|nr:3-hydroxyacyl-ACP dehydratase FabZ [Defluviitaleaceae bacterium]
MKNKLDESICAEGTPNKMTKNEIMEILPHRPPMLLIEEGELADGVSICRYTIKGDEFFLQGHFPGNPVVPGVIQCEMMAQASCFLVGKKDNNVTPYFTGMEKVRFKKKVVPGDCITLKSELVKQKGAFYFVKCSGEVMGEICCTAEISFALM